MDEGDLRLRNTTYQLFVEFGRAPLAAEVAETERISLAEVEVGWRRLHDAHALVLYPNGAIRMANPFSGVPTAYRVQSGGRSWFANCAWDAAGVCAALRTDGDIETACPCCSEAIRFSIREAESSDSSLLFHCLLPAASWWDDIGFT
ncbi:MAG: hypothetical protein NVS3B21_10600 [Acidimicrobiales bacterium]